MQKHFQCPSILLWCNLVVLMLFCGASHAAHTTFLADHETYSRHDWAAPTWNTSLSVVGYDATRKASGSASLKLLYDTNNWGGLIISSTLTDDVASTRTSFSMRVYVEPVGAATGVPKMKLETTGAGTGEECELRLNQWSTVRLSEASLMGSFTEMKIVVFPNGATGMFNIWVDNLRRDGVMWDAFDGPYTPVHAWVTPTWNNQLTVEGYTNEYPKHGRASLKLRFDPSSWGLVETPAFAAESADGLSEGFSIWVYPEAVGATTGTPYLKLETEGAGQSDKMMLLAGYWNKLVLPAAKLSGSYTRFKLVAVPGSNCTGIFNLYVDFLQKDGLLWDDFESPVGTAYTLANTDAGATYHFSGSQPASVPNDATYGDVPFSTGGSGLMALGWDGEQNGTIEVKWQFQNYTFDLDDQDGVFVDLFVPKDTFSAYPSTSMAFVPSWTWPGLGAYSYPMGGEWTTLQGDVSTNTSTGQTEVILVLNNLPTSGTLFFDNLRLANAQITGFAATPHCYQRADLHWDEDGESAFKYNVYRSTSKNGTYTKINEPPHYTVCYSDFHNQGGQAYYYKVRPVVNATEVSSFTQPVPSYALSMDSYGTWDEENFFSTFREATFRYFSDFAHPSFDMTRERYADYARNVVASGGSGFGLMALVTGVHNGFITRAQGARQALQMLTFLDEVATRYHGAFSHWYDGRTGEPIKFGDYYDGDLVETSFVVMGALTARQYFDSATDPVEIELRQRANNIYEDVEWDFFWDRTHNYLNWHWSPDVQWADTFAIRGPNEAVVTYLLAIGAPKHAVSADCYDDGYCGESDPNLIFFNGQDKIIRPNSGYWSKYQMLGAEPGGGPLFLSHYSFMGLNPNGLRDKYTCFMPSILANMMGHYNYAFMNYPEYLAYRHFWEPTEDQYFTKSNLLAYAYYGGGTPNNDCIAYEVLWGLTASYAPPMVGNPPVTGGYMAHQPHPVVFNDLSTSNTWKAIIRDTSRSDYRDSGVIAPTGALGCVPFTYGDYYVYNFLDLIYQKYAPQGLWGPYGFYDAFSIEPENLEEGQDIWICKQYVAIDQAPILLMMQNHKDQLLWDNFMSCPEVISGISASGMINTRRTPEINNTILEHYGVDYEYFEFDPNVEITSMPDFDNHTPVAQGHWFHPSAVVPYLRQRDHHYGFRITGYVVAYSAVDMNFNLISSDGAQFYLGDTLMIDNDGNHDASVRQWSPELLNPGKHKFTLLYYCNTGDNVLELGVTDCGITYDE